jgi:hypothetical protein
MIMFATVVREEHSLSVSERRMPEKVEKRLHNSPNITSLIKSRMMRWKGHIARKVKIRNC